MSLNNKMFVVGVLLIIVMFVLAVMKDYDESVKKSIREDELHLNYYNDGYNKGWQFAMAELKIFKDSAIKSGVARYEIFDELTGELRFVWVTASNTVPVNPFKLNASTE